MASTWFVNDAWPFFVAFDGGEVTPVDCSDVGASFLIDTTDALSAPTVEDLLPAGLSLWPVGPAWGTPDGVAPSTDSTIAKLTRALLSPLARLYARAWRLTEESRSATLVDSLEDWETEYGLPDPCITEPQTVEQRKARLRQKVAGLATITPEDLVRFCARLGFVVALEEPHAFRVGESSVGWGGEELSNTVLEQQFVLHIFEGPVWQFEVGVSEVGVDRLLDFDDGVIRCAIEQVRPAWTIPVLSFAPLPAAFILTDEDDLPLVDENDVPLLGFIAGA